MENKQHTIRIELTDAQRKELREQIGQDVEALELDLTEMEPRIAPTRIRDVVMRSIEVKPLSWNARTWSSPKDTSNAAAGCPSSRSSAVLNPKVPPFHGSRR